MCPDDPLQFIWEKLMQLKEQGLDEIQWWLSLKIMITNGGGGWCSSTGSCCNGSSCVLIQMMKRDFSQFLTVTYCTTDWLGMLTHLEALGYIKQAGYSTDLRICVYKYMHVRTHVRTHTHTHMHTHTHYLSFPRPRNNLFKASLLYSGGTMWNNFPQRLKSIVNKHTFKTALTKHLLNDIT